MVGGSGRAGAGRGEACCCWPSSATSSGAPASRPARPRTAWSAQFADAVAVGPDDDGVDHGRSDHHGRRAPRPPRHPRRLPPPPTTLPPAPGDPVARMEAPSIGLDWIVVSGVGTDELKKGPGHYPDTPLPGQAGNVGIAGHRTTYGAPFFDIDDLAAGDEVILTNTGGERFVYKVTEQFIVSPSQYEVLAPTDSRSSPSRRVTPGTRPASASSCGRSSTRPSRRRSRTAAPTTAAPTTAAPPTTDPGETVTTTPPESSTSAPPTTLAGRSPLIGGPELERGWFDDPDAWPQVALWGLALTGIAAAGLVGQPAHRAQLDRGAGRHRPLRRVPLLLLRERQPPPAAEHLRTTACGVPGHVWSSGHLMMQNSLPNGSCITAHSSIASPSMV